jgi:hypothetical protein
MSKFKKPLDNVDKLLIRIDNKINTINKVFTDFSTQITKKGERDYEFIEDMTDLLNEAVRMIIDLDAKLRGGENDR